MDSYILDSTIKIFHRTPGTTDAELLDDIWEKIKYDTYLHIYLINLDLKEIPFFLAKLTNLRNLSLSHNKITEVNINYLPPNLESLNLDSNEIKYFDSEECLPFKGINYLSIRSNKLKSISFSNFYCEKLLLEYNMIAYVSLVGCSLSFVSISHNKIKHFESFDSNIMDINISNNLIEHFDYNSQVLNRLNVCGNKLKKLTLNTEYLLELNATANELVFLDLRKLTKLRNVYLSANMRLKFLLLPFCLENLHVNDCHELKYCRLPWKLKNVDYFRCPIKSKEALAKEIIMKFIKTVNKFEIDWDEIIKKPDKHTLIL